MDLISKQEVLKKLDELIERKTNDLVAHAMLCGLGEEINEIPTQWVEINDVTFGKVYQNSFITFLSTETFDAVKNKLRRPKGKWII